MAADRPQSIREKGARKSTQSIVGAFAGDRVCRPTSIERPSSGEYLANIRDQRRYLIVTLKSLIFSGIDPAINV